MQTVLLGKSKHLFARFLLLQDAVLCRLDAHDNVIEHREAFDQLEVLVHHADAERVGIVRVPDLDHLTVLLDDALLRLVKTEQHAHQRGFACAVLAEQRVDLALFQLQCDIVIGDNTREPFCNVQHFNCILSFQIESPSFRFHGPYANACGDGNHIVVIILYFP